MTTRDAIFALLHIGANGERWHLSTYMREKIEALRSQVANGVSPAMATPLFEDGYTVNTAVIPQLVNFLLDAGVKGIFAGGTTGEGILLTEAERVRLHEATIAAVGNRGTVGNRAPVILHVGANRVDTAVSLAKHAQASGADAIAAITPYFYGISNDAIVSYYAAVAEAAPELPLLLYDMPHLAINGIDPGLVPQLMREVPTFAGLKTSRPDVQMVRRLIDAADGNLIVLAGNESACLGLLGLGVDGLISGVSTAVPEPFVAITKAVAAGDLATARKHQRCINGILGLLTAGVRIGGIKGILNERGIEVGTAVPPRPNATEKIWPQIQALLDKAK